MPTGYQIDNQHALYFLTFQVVEWVDVFTRKQYVEIVFDSLTHCRKNKGMKLWAFVIMTNHMHVIISSSRGDLSGLVRDFKRFTSNKILEAIEANSKESRQAWMLQQFSFAAKKHKRNSKYQFWRHDNHAIELVSEKFVRQRMAYIHNNPVRLGFIEHPDHWMYSSQRNYVGLDPIIEIDLIDI